MLRIRHKFASWRNLPRFVRYRVPATWLLLGVARLLVLVMPFKKMAPMLGQKSLHASTALLLPEQLPQARYIKQLIRVSSNYCPWNANCFAQAIVAIWWFGWYRLPYTLYFGLTKHSQHQMSAHAWVVAGPVAVTGAYSFDQYTVVGIYNSRLLESTQ